MQIHRRGAVDTQQMIHIQHLYHVFAMTLCNTHTACLYIWMIQTQCAVALYI